MKREMSSVVTDLVVFVALACASETDASLPICFALFASEDCLAVDIASWIRAQIAVIPSKDVIGILYVQVEACEPG